MNTTRPLKFCINSICFFFTVLSVRCICHCRLYNLIFIVYPSLKKFSYFTALSVWCRSQEQILLFSTNLIYVTKCIPGTICMVTILQLQEKENIFPEISLLSTVSTFAIGSVQVLMQRYQGLFTDRTVQHLLHKPHSANYKSTFIIPHSTTHAFMTHTNFFIWILHII